MGAAPERWQAELALDAKAALGEGPVWDESAGVLYWVDIDRSAVHRFDPATGEDLTIDAGEPVGAVALRADGGLVLARKSGFAVTDEWGAPLRPFAAVESDREETRMNDGACDSRGRFCAWRGGGCPPGRVGDRQVAELRDGQPRADAGRGSVGIGQSGARQHLGTLRSRDQSAGDAAQGRDPGSGQRLERHRSGRPERVTGPRPVRRRVGVQRHVRRLHAADVPAGARLEPAEPGQQVPHGRPAHPRRAFGPGDRRRRAHALRHLLAAGVEAVPARPGHQPELLGLQRRGPRLLRRRRDRRAREEGGGHRHRGGAARLPRGRPQHVRRHGSPGRRQGSVRHPRLRAGPAPTRLRRGAGIELDVQSGERAAAAGRRPAST